MAVGFAMADDHFNGGASPQFFLDLSVSAALLPGTEDPVWIWRVMAAIALVDIGPFDLAPGQRLGFPDHLAQGVPVICIAGKRLGVEDELPALAAIVGGGERDLYAKLVWRSGLAALSCSVQQERPFIQIVSAD